MLNLRVIGVLPMCWVDAGKAENGGLSLQYGYELGFVALAT